jgi:hypothetical protein
MDTDLIVALIGVGGALLGAAVGGWVTFKVAGPYWERAKLSAVQPLLEARLPAYEKLWELTEYGPEEAPKQLDQVARAKLANDLRAWYFEAGAWSLAAGVSCSRSPAGWGLRWR